MKTYSVRESASKKEINEFKEYPELLSDLLFSRGIKTKKEAEKFLNPDYDLDTHDSYLMKDMEKAVERILFAIKNKEKIVIWSDYDADGIPGAVVLHDFFKKIGFHNFINYIPDRHEEGFGLNIEGVREVAEKGAKVLITVDCGIADLEEAEEAGRLGMDVIITDHHLPSGLLPSAFAILNPKQTDCGYPEKMICGAVVAFKLVQALTLKLSTCNLELGAISPIPSGWEKWLLDMVGIATISDMVPLLGENRVFAYYGLKVLRKTPRPGLLKLFDKARINQNYLSEEDIGFTISPRINAASRMGCPMDAFSLLSTKDEAEGGKFAEHLDKINNERKGVVAGMVKEMKKKISERYSGNEKKKCIVLGNPGWKPSLLGLAANSIAEEHLCPVFLWGRGNGEEYKGSCRSDGSVNLVEVMKETSNGVFLEFGGHALSGGFSVVYEKVHLLEEEIIKALDKIPAGVKISPEILVDKKISLDDVNWKNYDIMEKMAPFGIGNPKPVFLFENARIAGVRNFGKEGAHLELQFEKSNGLKIPAISFFTKPEDFEVSVKVGSRVNLIANIEKSFFGRSPSLRLRIIDIL